MADRAAAKSKAQAHGKRKKKGAMDGMTVKGGHKLSTKQGAGLTKKGRDSINRRTGSNLKAPQPEGGARKKSFCARMRGMRKRQKPSNNTGKDRLSKALRKWKC